jgi:hypothetical protein
LQPWQHYVDIKMLLGFTTRTANVKS